ncbi:MAG: hypothetical protein R3228_07050, partial [Halioglobus sp.]|nr:hypothetical protein [Halioglobus sp.]
MNGLKQWLAILAAAACSLQAGPAHTSPLEKSTREPSSVKWSWEPAAAGDSTLEQLLSLARGGREQRVHLPARHSTVIRQPPGYWLRLVHGAPAGSHQAPPALWYSNGNGLFRPAVAHAGSGAGEWLLPPQGDGEITLLLENNWDSAMSWRLTRTRPLTPPLSFPFREDVAQSSAAPQWYFLRDRAEVLQLTPLAVGEEYAVTLSGPGEWRLEARTLPAPGAPWRRFLDVPLSLDGQHWRNWRMHPVVNYRDTLQQDFCARLSSAPESLYISLPEGEHRISLAAPEAMALRLRALRRPDFAFARNLPASGAWSAASTPQAQPAYDEGYLQALLRGDAGIEPLPPHGDQFDPSLAPKYSAGDLVQRRYRFWRRLPTGGNTQGSALANVVEVSGNRGDTGGRHYVPSAAAKPNPRALIPLAPGQSIDIEAPDTRERHELKLSLGMAAVAHELRITNRHGDITLWRWLPERIDSHRTDVASARDLPWLAGTRREQVVAAAAGTLTVAADEFPLTISHTASDTVWLSAYYRDDAEAAMGQSRWAEAATQLGSAQMLQLLLDQAPPSAGGSVADLRSRIWRDWLPLRRWLRSWQGLWLDPLGQPAESATPATVRDVTRLIDELQYVNPHLLRQILRGMVARDADATRRAQALDWLGAYYTDAGDEANLNAYHAWRFKLEPRTHLRELARWLAASGLGDMALRLYQLDGDDRITLPFLQAGLEQGWQLPAGGRTDQTRLWEALWRQDWAGAMQLAGALPQGDAWRRFAADAPRGGNRTDWLRWAAGAPSGATTRAGRIAPSERAPSLLFYNPDRDLHLRRFLASPDAGIDYRITGPVEVQLALR